MREGAWGGGHGCEHKKPLDTDHKTRVGPLVLAEIVENFVNSIKRSK